MYGVYLITLCQPMQPWPVSAKKHICLWQLFIYCVQPVIFLDSGHIMYSPNGIQRISSQSLSNYISVMDIYHTLSAGRDAMWYPYWREMHRQCPDLRQCTTYNVPLSNSDHRDAHVYLNLIIHCWNVGIPKSQTQTPVYRQVNPILPEIYPSLLQHEATPCTCTVNIFQYACVPKPPSSSMYQTSKNLKPQTPAHRLVHVTLSIYFGIILLDIYPHITY